MKMKTKHNIIHTLVLVAFAIIVFIWFIFMFWWIYPYKTSTQIQPYKVLNKEVKQGELLYYEMEYCKYTDTVPTVQRQFIDGIIYSIPTDSAQLKEGCGKLVNSIKIPNSLPVGAYYIHATVVYKMNPIRTITNEYVTEKFTVIR